MLVAAVAAVLGFVHDPAPFEVLATGSYLQAWVVDPELGVYLDGGTRVTHASGALARAAEQWSLEPRWRPVGRSDDRRFWVVVGEPIRFPARLFAWDGKTWTEGEVVLDRRARQQVADWKHSNAVFHNDALPVRIGAGVFLRDRLGVYGYAQHGRWLYRSFVPESGRSTAVGLADDAAHRVGDAGDAYFYRRGNPERILHWNGARWGFARGFPSGLPAKYEPVFRVGPRTWVGFAGGTAVRVRDGKRTRLPFGGCVPLAQHPRDASVLVRLHGSDTGYARLDADDNLWLLGSRDLARIVSAGDGRSP